MIQQKFQNLNPEKAEILGLLCAEGSHYNYTTIYNEYFKNRGKYYTLIRNIEAIEFTNLDKGLLQHFRKLMLSVYNYAPRPTGIKTSLKIRIKKKVVIEDLLSYTDFGCTKWSVPKELFNSNKENLCAFIRGLFDGDGTLQKYFVKLVSVNYEAVTDTSKILKQLGIESKVLGPYQQKGNRKSYYNLIIPKEYISKFKDIIGSFNNAGMAETRNKLAAMV